MFLRMIIFMIYSKTLLVSEIIWP